MNEKHITSLIVLGDDSTITEGSAQKLDGNEKPVDAPLAASQPDPSMLTTDT